MKRCAKCHAEYDDEYDACPRCAAELVASEKKRTQQRRSLQLLGIALLLLALGFIFDAFTPSSPGAQSSSSSQTGSSSQGGGITIENPELASEATKALTSLDVDESMTLTVLQATYAGAIVVQMTTTKPGPDWESKEARDSAQLISDAIFEAVSDTTRVAVLDGNAKLIEAWDTAIPHY